MTDETTEAATELYFAKRYAELGEWQEMYQHLWNAMDSVPEDATVMWEYEQTFHESGPDGMENNRGFGGASDPIDLIQSVLYGNNDLGTDYIHVKPARDTDE